VSEHSVEQLLREVGPRVTGALARRYGDVGDAEDAVQEALAAAATQWPAEGVPESPFAWLFAVAARRMTDRLRADSARRERELVAAARDATEGLADPPSEDDSLTLLFMCCHPALTPASAIPLTLRAVGGLTTAEIARAFLIPEATMAQRISRAKQRIKASGAPFAMPGAEEWDQRLRSLLHVLYLIFTEGHAASSGPEVARSELSVEAIRLARLLHRSLPEEPEVAGLLALMLLNEARRPARTGPKGELVPLAEQNRELWNGEMIAEGVALLSQALPRGRAGEYQLQAAIAAVHDEAATAAETDWPQILALYGVLEALTTNPVVTLNRAVAAAMVEGPHVGLAILGTLDDKLPRYHRLAAVRAHLLEMIGDTAGAVACYRAAAELTTSLPERDYPAGRAARLADTVAAEEGSIRGGAGV
jgi:RNA polymerase sigma factor (sigma-70 family)